MVELTEDETIDFLVEWLEKGGWEITNYTHGHEHGNDIEVKRNGEFLIVEAKGSKPDPKRYHKHEIFNSGQIKNHLGMALVKILEERHLHPNHKFAIAFPEDEKIDKCLKKALDEIKKIGIKLYWVTSSNEVREE